MAGAESKMKTLRCLYVSYFGLREPLVQRQVVPYLAELRQSLAGVWLLTFESTHPAKWSSAHRSALLEALAKRGVLWSHLRYHKRPTVPATAVDILLGALRIVRLVRRHRIDIVHCRGHVPMAMGALAKRVRRVRLVFDIRGFMPEEYVDAGVWRPGGRLFRFTKRVERHLLAAADAFVVLTERAREHLFAESRDADLWGRPITVIPSCVDLRDFVAPDPGTVARAKESLGIQGRRVHVYAGQLGGWYLDHALVEFLARARGRDPSLFAMILTPSSAEGLKEQLVTHGFDDTSVLIRAVGPEQVPSYLLAADVGLSFIKPCFSKISSSPTKIGEYLAAGLPVVSTAGIGDLDELLSANNAGWLLKDLDDAAFDEALRGIDTILEDACLRTRLYSIAAQALGLQSVGGPLYRDLYARLADRERDR
jgi:glycosyltransferase involved in cell wall biosynthesis